MKLKHAVIFVFLFFATATQAQDKLFERYSEKENVTSIYISKAMFNMISGLVDVKDLPIEALSDKLESLQILSAQESDEAAKMNKEFSSHVLKYHEELIRVKEGKSDIRIFAKQKGERVKELVLLAQTDDDFSVIRLLGNFTMKEIKDFAEKAQKKVEK